MKDEKEIKPLLARHTKKVFFSIDTKVLDNGGEIYEVREGDSLNTLVSQPIYTSTDEYDLTDWLEHYINEQGYTHVGVNNHTGYDVLGYVYDNLVDELVSELEGGVSLSGFSYTPDDTEEFEMICEFVDVDEDVAKNEEMWLQESYEAKVKALIGKGEKFKDFDGSRVDVVFSPREYWEGEIFYT